MMGRTHAIFGAGVVVPIALISGQPAVIGIGLISALVPDLDASDGALKHWYIMIGSGKNKIRIKPFYPIAEIVSLFFKHRGFLHSLYAAIIFGVVLLIFTPWYYAFAGFFGYLSHIILDACTPAGVPLLLLGDWHLLPKHLRIRTGSYVENLFLVAAGALVFVYMIPILLNGLNTP